MTKLVFFLVAFAYLGLWKTIIYTRAIDSLKPGDQLKVYDELCSATAAPIYKIYCMFFLAIGGRGYFVVYDYSIDYAVWMANRDEPLVTGIVPEAAALTLDHSGVLKITRKSGEPIILDSSAQHQDINNTVATLLDSGNFVLQQLYPNGSKSVLWQSFDYPTNTLLPGMKLGVDHKTGRRWSIVSRFLYNVPASGAFSLEWEPERRQLVIRRRDQVYWASGELRDNKFENIPEEVQDMYDYNIDEDSIKFMARNDQYYDPWILSSEGALFASSGKEIARADECYRNNGDRGCQRWDVPTCRHVNEKFDIISARVKYADNLNGSADPAASSTTTDCKDACWRNCDCVGFTNLYDNGTGCYFIYGTWENIQGGSDIFHKLDIKTPTLPKTSTDQKGKPMEWRRWKWIIAVIIIALFMINGCILWLVKKRRKLKLEEKKGTRMEHTILQLENSNGFEDVNNNRDSMKHGHELRLFSYASIMEATNDFSSTNKLGEGGFGPVYKGIIMQKEVAVKRLSRSSRQGVVEFKNELKLVSELQHINLVKLLGCCVHGDERILIYEYMPNKSLDFFLFDSARSKQLDWKKRLNIIEGIAQGLLYLHKYSRLRIVHRDLKASNILLDEYMNPKISDFGMARIFMQESEENTTRIVGTFGYMPPEYAMNGVFSRKSDVYGFGVLMLEIVSGRRNNSFNNTSNPINLVGHAWELWKEGLTLELVDPTINDSVVQDQMLRCIHVGLLCVEECAVDRPTMSEILAMLSNSNEILPSLKKPAFYFGGRVNAVNESSKHPKIDSINGMSISDLFAR